MKPASITFITKQVLGNAQNAKLALETYEAIGNEASNINRSKFKFFFGFNQKAMLDFTILQICKLYDKSNKKYKKHTVLEIVEYLKKNKKVADYQNVCAPNLNTHFNNSIIKKKSESDIDNIEGFLKEAEYIIEKLITSNSFVLLKTFRDKYIAHAEIISTEQIKYLPSTDEINLFIDVAMDLSVLIYNFFSQDSCLVGSTLSMKMATQNLIANIIDKDYE